MSLTQTHNRRLAERIDKKVKKILKKGASDLDVFAGMTDYMDDFKTLMDTSSQADMDRLCARYDGFYRYAKVLESIARGIESGDISVP